MLQTSSCSWPPQHLSSFSTTAVHLSLLQVHAAGWAPTPVCAVQLHCSHTGACPLCRRKRRKLNQTRGRPCGARLHAASVAAEARAEGLNADDEGNDEPLRAGAAVHTCAQPGGYLQLMYLQDACRCPSILPPACFSPCTHSSQCKPGWPGGCATPFGF